MKKMIALLLCLVLAFSSVMCVNAERIVTTKWTYGDVNWDGRIDTTDALWMLLFPIVFAGCLYELDPNGNSMFYKSTMENNPHFVLYDLDVNYKVDAGDALLVLQRCVKLIDSFPADSVPFPPHEE